MVVSVVVHSYKEKRKGYRCSSPSTGTSHLSGLSTGDHGVIAAMHSDEQFHCKMLSLGIVPGASVTIVSSGYGQLFILKEEHARLILSWGQCRRLLSFKLQNFNTLR